MMLPVAGRMPSSTHMFTQLSSPRCLQAPAVLFDLPVATQHLCCLLQSSGLRMGHLHVAAAVNLPQTSASSSQISLQGMVERQGQLSHRCAYPSHRWVGNKYLVSGLRMLLAPDQKEFYSLLTTCRTILRDSRMM